MNQQLELAPSHAHDPAESRIAAARVDAKGQLKLVLLCLLHAEEPLTDDAIAARCGLLRTSAGTRRGVAYKLGYVEKAGRGLSALGNPASRWRLTPDGRAEAIRLGNQR